MYEAYMDRFIDCQFTPMGSVKSEPVALAGESFLPSKGLKEAARISSKLGPHYNRWLALDVA